MRRVVLCAVLTLVAVLLQVMLVDRLPLPGGIVPDVVLVIIVAIGLTRGPMTGTITGFFAGLELDLVPPGGHLIGESALIFCLVGYACGRLSGWLGRSAPRLLAAAMIGVAAGEFLQAAAGMIAGDPGVTLTAVRQVLPVAVLYDVLICPVVLFLAALASRRPAVRQLTARQFRRAPRIGMGTISGRHDRTGRALPRWPARRFAVPGGRTGRTGPTGGPP
jgi:rod shape-determining protein MreD